MRRKSPSQKKMAMPIRDFGSVSGTHVRNLSLLKINFNINGNTISQTEIPLKRTSVLDKLHVAAFLAH